MLASDDPWLKAYFHGKRAQSLVVRRARPARQLPNGNPRQLRPDRRCSRSRSSRPAFGFVFWFSGGDAGAKPAARPRRLLRLGLRPLAGLDRALQRPPQVGEVTTSLDPDDPSRVVAEIEVDRTTPIRTDTRARLEFQGLTGVARSRSSAATPARAARAGARAAACRRSLPTAPTSRTSWRRPAASRGGPTTCSSASASSSPTTKARSTAPSPMSSASRWR